MQNVAVIGSGFSSLAAAAYLADSGYEVVVYEKNASIGGRARQLKKEGFTFDMGPTWYWMPDVFERFFNDLGEKVEDYYQLEKLSPGYQVYFGENDSVLIGDEPEKIYAEFERIEAGSSEKLRKFLKEAEYNYEVAIKDLVYRPGLSPLELVTPQTVTKVGQFFTTIKKTVEARFKDDRLRQLVMFPVLFLGAKPSDTPAFYSFMNYADYVLGTWYPKGGMFSVVTGMQKLLINLGVKFELNAGVEKINVVDGKVTGLRVNGKDLEYSLVLSGADYHHTESLLEESYRVYSSKFWKKRTFAPSALLFYVGFGKKLDGVEHHTLFFDESFEQHAKAIYDDKVWPEKPLFYASFPSRTEAETAPEGCETGIFLIPLASGLEDTEEVRQQYFRIIMDRFQHLTGLSVKDSILFHESYCVNDFVSDYNAYGGNAYGLANTLLQTGFLRPRIKSRKVKGLYFTGQLTVPGPGVPPSLISGKIVSDLLKKENPIKESYERTI